MVASTYTTSKGDEVPAMSNTPLRQLATVRATTANAHAWLVIQGSGCAFATVRMKAGSAPPIIGIANMNVMNGL